MREVPISRGLTTLVDDEEYERVMAAGPWHANPRGRTVHVQRNVRRPGGGWTTQGLHNFVTGLPYVDHENGNGLDNQKSNLREADNARNAANQRMNVTNTAGYKGVQRHPSRSRPWRAQIGAFGKKHHLGLFATPEAAARAYDAAALRLHGTFARLNFPGETS